MIVKSLMVFFQFIFALLFINCSGSGSSSSSGSGSSSSNEIDNQLTKFPEGRDLYLSKCTSCHRAYEREMFTAEKWKTALEEMTVKAKLNDEEKTLILNYLSERN
ncbi:MAG: hypothetical protein IPJ03_06235 [Ignavibacteriales bacterium]|nr:hypothetical protein [Ignavibacteriales bacterium]